jgi:hypothetical protein
MAMYQRAVANHWLWHCAIIVVLFSTRAGRSVEGLRRTGGRADHAAGTKRLRSSSHPQRS